MVTSAIRYVFRRIIDLCTCFAVFVWIIKSPVDLVISSTVNKTSSNFECFACWYPSYCITYNSTWAYDSVINMCQALIPQPICWSYQISITAGRICDAFRKFNACRYVSRGRNYFRYEQTIRISSTNVCEEFIVFSVRQYRPVSFDPGCYFAFIKSGTLQNVQIRVEDIVYSGNDYKFSFSVNPSLSPLCERNFFPVGQLHVNRGYWLYIVQESEVARNVLLSPLSVMVFAPILVSMVF